MQLYENQCIRTLTRLHQLLNWPPRGVYGRFYLLKRVDTPRFAGAAHLGQDTSLHTHSLSHSTRWKSGGAAGHGRPAKDWNIRAGRRVPSANVGAILATRSQREQGLLKGESLQRKVTKLDVWDEKAASHASGMALVFLGTGTGHPGEQRRAGAVGLKLLKSTWLFDAGEDTQRQVHKQPLIRHGKVDRIFITNRRSSNILGLPGLLCTMSAARVIGLDVTDVPLHIYGPPGLSEFIRPLLHLSDTYIAMPVVVHEFVEHAVPSDQLNEPTLLDERCSLYRVLVPPDKLNPQGYTKAILAPMLDRGNRATRGVKKGADERLNHRELNLPPPGDSGASIDGGHDLRWTLQCGKDNMVTAVKVAADVESYAYILQEADRIGRLNVAAAERLGIYGMQRNDIKAGMSVTNDAGETIRPEQICGPDIMGRRLAFVGECADSACLEEACRGADAVIYAASCPVVDESRQKRLRSTIDQATALMRSAQAHHLLLYRFKPEDKQGIFRSAEAEEGTNKGTFGLNLLNNFRLVEKRAPNGYVRRAANTWSPVVASPQSKQAAGAHIKACLGDAFGYSIPDDMDLYVVDRADITDTPVAELQAD